MSETTSTMHEIKGTYRDSPGGITLGHGKLLVEKLSNGLFRDPVNGGTIRARRIKLTDKTTGVCVRCSQSIYYFDPNWGELERIGMPVHE